MPDIQKNYTKRIAKVLGNNPVILVDDTDVIKPHGKKFEALGKVKDDSSKDNKIEKGYLVTEMVGLTASKNPVNLVLATNKIIKGKEDVVDIVRTYMSRWRIEEYFRFKKQHFGFKNFRVRSLRSINNLNQLLTYAIGLLGILAEKMNSNYCTLRIKRLK
ncbi:protein of unknown function [Tepidanaerobacter acetatoxydans Re1]|uniref:Transposase IS4-like domain-containing protein n=1 Tax=Tepidanaerobacter acetatoxydans (strain DSM 21804 / JCM 16047 / Re1) TaxID=1209989 RepID=L0RXX9_TEPAE|nr:transposase [Tepidanaerobacter acetatoxydans]CCP25751.1 protein of unknown function [Tepidanaerobacter acetatoxydans Re1]